MLWMVTTGFRMVTTRGAIPTFENPQGSIGLLPDGSDVRVCCGHARAVYGVTLAGRGLIL